MALSLEATAACAAEPSTDRPIRVGRNIDTGRTARRVGFLSAIGGSVVEEFNVSPLSKVAVFEETELSCLPCRDNDFPSKNSVSEECHVPGERKPNDLVSSVELDFFADARKSDSFSLNRDTTSL